MTMKAMFVGLAIAAATTQASACNSIAGAIPSTRCPDEARTEWWAGTWATRMDDGGRKLTAFTRLDPSHRYATTLAYDDGTRIEHSGRFDIEFDEGFERSYRYRRVGDLGRETRDIEEGVGIAKRRGFVPASIAGAIPRRQGPPKDEMCLEGRIRYEVTRHPEGYEFDGPQEFTFVTQGPGYLRTSGPGADGVLSRKYR